MSVVRFALSLFAGNVPSDLKSVFRCSFLSMVVLGWNNLCIVTASLSEVTLYMCYMVQSTTLGN